MKIWLINAYGPIPINQENWREYRSTITGNYLSSLGHEVVWYTSSFSHHFKKQRSKTWKDLHINSRFIIRLVPTPGYKKNVSIGRYLKDVIFSLKVYRERKVVDVSPDLIISGESPLTFGYAGYRLAKYFNIPIIYDQGDLWPEFIINIFPDWMQLMMNWLFFPVFFYRKKMYNHLDGIISLAELYLLIPLKIAPSLVNKPHAIIYNGIDVDVFRNDNTNNEDILKLLPEKSSGDIWFVFAGTLGPSYDLLNLLKVADKLFEENSKTIKFIIAGDGPLRKEILSFIENHSNQIITYLGHLSPDFLISLYKYCDVGLSIYTKISNVEMPDKFYDYTAAGLPIINSLTGEVGRIISIEKIGLQYKSGSIKELYDAIQILNSDTLLRKEMAQNSFLVGSRYDKKNQISKLGLVISNIFDQDTKGIN